ncbi:hypothetical protein A3844_01740 [Paenibacillus helianthi]|uniref:Uncharacterized protein n=1 Tax=Paenibacillus helianthi TaxID=1349432 RepID=A0ABX3EUI2_9BACL|nr:hypothetical protein A3844_01740 [Paenibacillus helianthi]
MVRKQNSIRPPLQVHPKQPKKCVGCIWGEWTGTKQFCSRVKCQKEKTSWTSKYDVEGRDKYE